MTSELLIRSTTAELNFWEDNFFPWHWEETTRKHNEMFCNKSAYELFWTPLIGIEGLYDLGFNFSTVGKAYMNPNQSNFEKFQRSVLDKFKNGSEAFNILFSGGSVCAGVGTLNLDESLPEDYKNGLRAWGSYPRRLIFALQEAFNEIADHFHYKRIFISGKVCCTGGSSSIVGIENMYAKKYSCGKACGSWVDYTHSKWNANSTLMADRNDTGWSPDLFIWDHSANDGNPKFFDEMKPRRQIYESFIVHMLRLHNKPQVIVFDSVVYIRGERVSETMDMKRERLEINNIYGVPTIDYDVFNPAQQSIWYATSSNNPHPLWPTHLIWTELLFYTLLNQMRLSFGDEKNISLNANVSDDRFVNMSLNETSSCNNGYTTMLDFTQKYSNIEVQQGDSSTPLQIIGNWKISNEANKKGWLYLKSSDLLYDYNSISFSCHKMVTGHVSIGYYASYSPEWGVASVNITTITSNISIAVLSIEEINARWNERFSVVKLLEVDLPLSYGLDAINITISVQERRKFKVTSIACC